MNILYVIPEGIDMGGIITSTEQLLQGFREIGHTANFALIRPTKTQPREREIGCEYVRGEGTGLMMHPVKGWRGPYFSIGCKESMEDYMRTANSHDLIVWGSLYGLRNHITEGHSEWLKLFSSVEVPQIAMIRDDHLEKRYPWVSVLEKWIVGWACVQQASYDTCRGLKRPRAVIFSGHDIDGYADKQKIPYRERERKILSIQTFKKWKRVHCLIYAIPHLNSDTRVCVAGDGIELRYMRSKTKCPYYCTAEADPDRYKNIANKKIWDNALNLGMMYLGTLSEKQRDKHLSTSKFLVDLSTRKNSTGQINRVIVEAIRCGCVPIAVNSFIAGRNDGMGELFKAYKHYLPIDTDKTPKQLASAIEEHLQISKSKYEMLQQNGFDRIRMFDRKISAKNLIDLGLGKTTGWKYGKGENSRDLEYRGKEMFEHVFGKIKPK